MSNRIVLLIVFAILVLAVTAVIIAGRLQKEIGDRVEQVADKKFDEVIHSGGSVGGEAKAYTGNIVFENMEAEPVGSDYVQISGIVRNNGDRTVTSLKVHVSLLDEDGVEVAGRTDYFAHSFPFGDNNTPINPNSAKRIQSHLTGTSGWQGGEVRVSVLELALK